MGFIASFALVQETEVAANLSIPKHMDICWPKYMSFYYVPELKMLYILLSSCDTAICYSLLIAMMWVRESKMFLA